MKSTVEGRRKHVRQMRANFAIENMLPDDSDIALQVAYISGNIGLDVMLAHAYAYAKLAAQQELLNYDEGL